MKIIKRKIKYPERLLALADHIETVPETKFDMGLFRGDELNTPDHCGSVGCVVGHAPIMLLTQFNLPTPVHPDGSIDFSKVSLQLGVALGTMVWDYLFSATWKSADNTTAGAAKRIRWVVAHEGVPKDGYLQSIGSAPLSYTQEEETI